jgi:hypothetical protein
MVGHSSFSYSLALSLCFRFTPGTNVYILTLIPQLIIFGNYAARLSYTSVCVALLLLSDIVFRECTRCDRRENSAIKWLRTAPNMYPISISMLRE